MRRSGKCPDCPYRWSVKKDGTMGNHLLYHAYSNRGPCSGSGKPAVEGTVKATK